MNHTAEMQRYIEALRKEIENTNLRHATECEDTEARLFQTKVTGIVVSGILLCLTIWIGLSNMEYATVNTKLKAQVEELDQSNLQQRFNNILEALYHQNGRVLELEQANEALMHECDPSGRDRAIKATPLPKIGV